MKVIQFNWSPSVDGFFLEAAPTNEYLATPGLLDRFKFFLGYNSGEVAMGAAFARTKRAFEVCILTKPLKIAFFRNNRWVLKYNFSAFIQSSSPFNVFVRRG